MKNVYVAISTVVVKLSIDEATYDDAAANALTDYPNTMEGIQKLLVVLSHYTLATVDFSSSGHPASRDARNKLDDRVVIAAIAALWRYNASVTSERDALLVVAYDPSRRGVVTQISCGQFDNSVVPYMGISFGRDGVQQEEVNLMPRVYVRIGTTVQSPIIGVRLKDGRIASEAAAIVDGIADTEDAIERYMGMLGQYASAFYYCYIAEDKDAEQLIARMRTDQLAVAALLLERCVRNRKPGAIPVLAVSLKDRTKPPIDGYAIRFLPKPPIPPELQASFTLGDPEARVLN